ncbi:CYTH and CHAD domain-containing protein [Rhodococcus jostii]|uniref:Inorganic triphosphatase YgiF, contains CYTH and CHAD domains n=1 Tax=Rhodococcus jostii TaxID=132919 RepID=A0A1H5DP27_RHOJO|nr:CYTH and CHAD domain-containing protein [Rhodococcus jostii]SED80612.1 Inorganic triphosphatase YgiF, contains CYTH and CHAD domains [Rhodococcus jostii]
MVSTQREREDKYEVGLEFVLPDLEDVIPRGGRVEQATVNLSSVYYDTADRDLLRQHLTFRRRTGDADVGWHLKVPADKDRTEIRMPPGESDTIPDELATLIVGVALGKSVHPVATLTTVRRMQRVLDSDDRLVAEVADDRVRGTVAGDRAVVSEWREVEVEAGDAGSEKLLGKIGKRLTLRGAKPSRYPSKLSRVLSTAQLAVDGGDTSRGTTESVLAGYLDAQAQAIVAGDVWLRRGLDPVHPTLVGIRRFCSTLRVFTRLLEPTAATELAAELSWYAGLLGEVRDRQVQRARFTDALADLPSELVMGPVAARIESDLIAEQQHHLQDVMATVDGDRYRALLAALARWRTNPPLTAAAADGPRVIERALRKAERKAHSRVATAAVGTDDTALHRALEAATRARYAAELAAPVLGKKTAKKKAAHFEKMQKVLGEHRDSVVAAETLRTLGARAGTTSGENGFTFGLLYGLELERARQAREDAAQLAAD